MKNQQAPESRPALNGIPTYAETARTSELLLRQLSQTLQAAFEQYTSQLNALSNRSDAVSKKQSEEQQKLQQQLDALTTQVACLARQLESLTVRLNTPGPAPY
jgi:uncharacterized protein YlxW (UPF0749 family)